MGEEDAAGGGDALDGRLGGGSGRDPRDEGGDPPDGSETQHAEETAGEDDTGDGEVSLSVSQAGHATGKGCVQRMGC